MKAPSSARRLLGTAARASGLDPERLASGATLSAVTSAVAAARVSTGDSTGADDGIAETARTLFDPDWYRTQAGLDGASSDELFDHYRAVGAARGLSPHPLVDPDHYRRQLGPGEACTDPVEHYLTIGASRGLDPHPLLDGGWYLDHYEDVARAGQLPLVHYVNHGAIEGRAPGPDFDGGWYLDEYRDVAEAGMNPLVHYWLHGRHEGRFASAGAKRSLLVTVNNRLVNIGVSLPLDSTAWHGPAGLLDPPARPVVRLDPQALAEHKVVSFDVWDTLIMRRCHPEEVKLASARHLLFGFHRWIRPQLRSVQALYRARLAAEARVSFGDDREYRFSEAAVAWVEDALVPTASAEVATRAAESLVANELAAEIRVTYRNPAMDPVLPALAGRTLVFASDFYLPANAIQRLLTANGVEANFARSWVSCEQGESKRSGRMFARILDEMGVDGLDLVHIGDNAAADVDAAIRAGVRAVHHEVERQPELDVAVADRIAGDDEAYEAHVGAVLDAVEAGLGDDADRLTVLGVRFAPVAIGLALRIVEEAIAREADTIACFTREGVLLERLIRAIADADPYGLPVPPTELIEVSRRATFAASLADFEPAELMRLWSMYSTQSPRGLVASLGLDEEPARTVFDRHGLDFDEPVRHPWEDAGVRAAIADPELRLVVDANRAEQRELLNRYLDDRGLADGNLLVVDLGWRGTIQDNLAQATDRAMTGVYLGLYRFLNDQPTNGDKVGWLFDHNDDEADTWTIDEVAPLEMVFNAPGGSVTSYRLDRAGDTGETGDEADDRPEAGTVVAEREIDPAEEAVITGPVAAFQAGILAATGSVLDLVARHGLTSDDLRPLARKLAGGLVRQPPPEVAEAFFALSHNETFGTGAFEEMEAAVDLDAAVEHLTGNELYSAIAEATETSRWPEGMGARAGSIVARSWRDTDNRPLHIPTRVFASAPDVVTDGSVAIFAPAPIVGSGGHRTIYNLARSVAATGLDVQLFVDGAGQGLDDAVSQLRGSGVGIEVGWKTSSSFDYALATVAASAAHVRQVSARHRGYLVQDFEASFNPMSDGYIEAESSYTDGFDFLTVGSWLGHVLQTRYASPAFSSGLGADAEIYRPIDRSDERPPGVCFLYQPEKPRRTPQLGMEALRLVKRACPDVEIHVYGSEAELDLDIEVVDHGLIRDLSELNELYNRCRVGLCLSMTNPSRIPFELMAAGAVPVEVYRYNTLFDYDDGTAVLAYQSPDSLAEAMVGLLTDDQRWRDHQRRCLDFVSRRPLAWETEVMVNTILARISGLPIEAGTNRPTYRDEPVIAETDDGRATTAFCDWQRRSAEL